MLFITRHMNSPESWSTPVTHADLHIAEREFDPTLPEWRKMPYCRNGGINLQYWEIIELDATTVHASRICGACRNRVKARQGAM